MSGTELALRIVFAAVTTVCLLLGILVDDDKLGCLGFLALAFVGSACFVGALAGPDAAARWAGATP